MERRRQQSAHDFVYSFCLPTQPTKKAALALTSSNILKHFWSSSALTTRAMIFRQAQQQPGNFYSKVCAKLGTKLAAKVVWQQNPKRARQHLVIERNHDYSFGLGTNWPKPEEFPFQSGIWNTYVLPTAWSCYFAAACRWARNYCVKRNSGTRRACKSSTREMITTHECTVTNLILL